MTKRAPIVLAIAGLLFGCSDESGGAAPPPEAPKPYALPSARRPARRYFMERTSRRCEIYWEEDEIRLPPIEQPCPEWLLVGERIRVAGKTCIVENASAPQREKPVVCPDPLTNLEKRERRAAAAGSAGAPPSDAGAPNDAGR